MTAMPLDPEEREARRRARDAARKREARARARGQAQADARLADRRRAARRLVQTSVVLLACVAVATGLAAVGPLSGQDGETATRLTAVLAGLADVEARLHDRLSAPTLVPAVSLAPAVDPALADVSQDTAAAAANSAAALNVLGALRQETATSRRQSSELVAAVTQLRGEVADLRTTVATAPVSLMPPASTSQVPPASSSPVPPAAEPVEAPVTDVEPLIEPPALPTYDFTIAAGDSLLAILDRACQQAAECDAVVSGTDAVWRAGVSQTVRLTWDDFLAQMVQGFPAARAQPWIVLHANRVIELRDRM